MSSSQRDAPWDLLALSFGEFDQSGGVVAAAMRLRTRTPDGSTDEEVSKTVLFLVPVLERLHLALLMLFEDESRQFRNDGEAGRSGAGKPGKPGKPDANVGDVVDAFCIDFRLLHFVPESGTARILINYLLPSDHVDSKPRDGELFVEARMLRPLSCALRALWERNVREGAQLRGAAKANFDSAGNIPIVVHMTIAPSMPGISAAKVTFQSVPSGRLAMEPQTSEFVLPYQVLASLHRVLPAILQGLETHNSTKHPGVGKTRH